MQRIIHVLNINASQEIVYEAIATIKGLSNWWSKKVNGGESEGDILDFTFIEAFNPDMKIARLKEPSEVRWLCVAGHDLWQDNKFLFEISDKGEAIQLKFTQEYANPISDEDYGIYNFNWAYYLESLKEYCETGIGKPFSPVD